MSLIVKKLVLSVLSGFAMGVGIFGFGGLPVAWAHAPSESECDEFSQHMANNRMAMRDAEAEDREALAKHIQDRMETDLVLIRQYPPDLRWFYMDEADEDFGRDFLAYALETDDSVEAVKAVAATRCQEYSKSQSK